jgi:thioredoxin-related protein
MIRKLLLGLTAAAFLSAQNPPASKVMETAQAEASAQNKTIFLIFHASWCGWCKQLDKFIATPENKAILGKYFVEARLDVEEHGEQKSLENPGSEDVMTRVAGKERGLPFFAFLDAKGEVIVNSIRPGDARAKVENIGYPGKPWETDWFMIMLKKAAPAMTVDEAKILEKWLRDRQT